MIMEDRDLLTVHVRIFSIMPQPKFTETFPAEIEWGFFLPSFDSYFAYILYKTAYFLKYIQTSILFSHILILVGG